MPSWTDYTKKQQPSDNDLMMIEDVDANLNKRLEFSGLADWIVEKLKKNNVISGALKFKGSSAYASLPTNPEVNDYYYSPDGNGTDGAGYYAWNGTAWIFIGNNDKGVDSTFTVEGAAADSKAVGDKFAKVDSETASLKEDLGDLGLNLYSDISKNILKMKDVAETPFNGLNYSVTDNIVTLKGTTNKAGTLYLDLESDINAGNYFFNNFMTVTTLLSGVSCGLIKDEDYSHTVELSLGTVDNKAISVTNPMNRMYIYFPANATSDAIYKMCITSERTNKYIPKNVYTFVGIMDDLITKNNEKLRSEFTPKDPTVINCWGDSLTMGAGAKIGETDYPTVLKTMIKDYKVNNYGVGGQRAEQIALRMSAIPAYVKPFTVPTITRSTDIPIKLYSTGGYNADFGDSTFAVGTGTNNARIGDFEGPLVVNSEKQLCFRVFWNSKEKSYSRPIRIYPASLEKRNEIAIIWVGTNNINDTVEHIIDVQKLMVSTVTSNKYIIVGLTAKTYFEDIANYNRKMYQTFGEHFVDVRKYILEYGLSDAGITATDNDKQAIQSGEMPPSLIYQGDGYGVHFLPAGYKIVAAQIYKKGIELGYWD